MKILMWVLITCTIWQGFGIYKNRQIEYDTEKLYKNEDQRQKMNKIYNNKLYCQMGVTKAITKINKEMKIKIKDSFLKELFAECDELAERR